jgi:hypothetical protein
MINSAAIAGLSQRPGTVFPAAPGGRAESARQSRDGTLPQAQNGAGGAEKTAGRGAEPVSAQRAPLLSAENQIAAQEARNETGSQTGKPSTGNPSDPQNLTEEEKKKVQELQKRDREVRAHEQAHKAAGGAHAGNPTYKTVRGPDGRSYAVSGEVKIDTSAVPNNPEATIRKMEQVKRAALAPANPSSQDRRVAAEAEAKIQKARQEKREEEAEELKKANEKNGGQSADPTAPDAIAKRDPLAPQPLVPMPGGASPSTTSPGSLFSLVA